MSIHKWKTNVVKNPLLPKSPDSVRVLCLSDIHALHHAIPKHFLPPADIFLCAGDISMLGGYDEVLSFKNWLITLPYEYRVVVAGNHDLTFDLDNYDSIRHPEPNMMSGHDYREVKLIISNEKNIIYLENQAVELLGIKVYGSPCSVKFHDWAFPVSPNQDSSWAQIPLDTDILITHGGPYKILDKCLNGVDDGDPALLKAVQRIRPSLSVFGHIHEAYGLEIHDGTTFINASITNLNYQITNPPILVDFIPKSKF